MPCEADNFLVRGAWKGELCLNEKEKSTETVKCSMLEEDGVRGFDLGHDFLILQKNKSPIAFWNTDRGQI